MTAPEPVRDDAPVLAATGPEFGDPEATSTQGVDVESMPALRDFRRMLPADRLAAQVDLGAVAAALPDSLTDGDVAPEDMLSADNLAAIRGIFQQMQAIVLDNAADRAAMEDWLIAQESGENALVHAFERVAGELGNRRASTG